MGQTSWLTVVPDAIPAELRTGKRWVAWRGERRRGEAKLAKVPRSPNAPKGASSTSPSHWTTFQDALAYQGAEKVPRLNNRPQPVVAIGSPGHSRWAKCKGLLSFSAPCYARAAHLDGVMRAFDGTDDTVGIDLDGCRDPETGELAAWAADIVRRLDSYTEVSPSGTGVKVWIRARLPAHGRKRGLIEMYDAARFFVVTGHHLAGTPGTVGYRPDAVAAIPLEVFEPAPQPTTTAERDGQIPALERDDEDVLRRASESQHNGERFRRLWVGDTSDYARDGNDGTSEADAALCERLAFYGGCDPEQIDRLFRQSGLYRDKWDERRGSSTYGAGTIQFVLRGKERFYGDGLHRPPAPTTETSGAELARLRRSLLDRDEEIEALEQTARRFQRAFEHEQAGRAWERRFVEAERALRRSALSSIQVDAFIEVARITTRRAQHFDTDEVIATGEHLAAGLGVTPKTANAAASLVCAIPGSPITRRRKMRENGRPITLYTVASRDVLEVLDRMVEAVAGLGAQPTARSRPSTRTTQRSAARRPASPCCPGETVVSYEQHACGRCGGALEIIGLDRVRPLSGEVRPITDSLTPVLGEVRPIAAGQTQNGSASDDDTRALAMTTTGPDIATWRRRYRMDPPAPQPIRGGCQPVLPFRRPNRAAAGRVVRLVATLAR